MAKQRNDSHLQRDVWQCRCFLLMQATLQQEEMTVIYEACKRRLTCVRPGLSTR